jgi:hypothetical protein
MYANVLMAELLERCGHPQSAPVPAPNRVMINKSGITFGIKLTFQRRNCPTLAICFSIARRTVAAEGFFSKNPSFCPILWPDFDYSYRGTVPVTLK